MRFILGLLFILTFMGCVALHKNPDATTKWNRKCGPVGISTVEVCTYTIGEKPDKTIFYFHGLADSVMTVEMSIYNHAGLQKILEAMAPAKVVVISYGKSWWMKAFGSPSVDEMAHALIPKVNGDYGPLPRPWLAIGHSMGGMNLASMCMLLPMLFDKCVLTNPALVSMEKFKNHDYVSAGNILDDKFTEAEWAEFNPFALLKDADILPQIYLTACPTDKFGLYQDSEAFHLALKQKGFNHVWSPGGAGCSHGDFEPSAVINFLK